MLDALFAVAEANATSANMKAGFDSLAVALEGIDRPLRNKVAVGPACVPGKITVYEKIDSNVPTDWAANCASRAAISGVMNGNVVASELIKRYGLRIITETNIPNPAGMGSSGASAAAGMKAAVQFVKRYDFTLDLSQREQIEVAVVGETARHYDNVSAAVLGGLVQKLGNDFERHDVPEWYVLLAKPAGVTKGSTAQGRSLLSDADKKRYETDSRITGTSSAIVHCMRSGNLKGLSRTMSTFEDPVERIRAGNGFYGKGITPEFLGAIYRTLANENIAAWVSGAGPYVLAVVGDDRNRIGLAKNVFTSAYKNLGYEPQFIEARLSNLGARNL